MIAHRHIETQTMNHWRRTFKRWLDERRYRFPPYMYHHIDAHFSPRKCAHSPRGSATNRRIVKRRVRNEADEAIAEFFFVTILIKLFGSPFAISGLVLLHCEILDTMHNTKVALICIHSASNQQQYQHWNRQKIRNNKNSLADTLLWTGKIGKTGRSIWVIRLDWRCCWSVDRQQEMPER